MDVVPGWMLDEEANAGRENLDAGHVARYDSKEHADAEAEVELLKAVGLDSSSIVIEFGVGTGQFALAAAPWCRRVVAVDVSPPMLDQLRTNVDNARLSNIDVVHGGFLTYEHSAKRADFVYSRYALHHLPDAWKAVALARIHDMMEPGGALRLWDVVYNFEPRDAHLRFESWCATGQDTVAFEPLDNGWGRWELEEHVRDEHSTFTWILEAMFARTGFAIETAEYSDDAIFAKYMLRRLP